MTPDAMAALERIGWSRRDFLCVSGGLVVGFSANGLAEPIGFAQGPFDTRPSHIDPDRLDSWIAIAADGHVTAYTGKAELGQGMFTAQTQLVAEELAVPIASVTLIQCDTAVCPDQGTTSGSQSSPTNFNNRGLAQAAATAREHLLALASARLGLPTTALVARQGAIVATANPAARVAYGDLVAGQKLNVTVDPRAARRPADAWTVLGTAVSRLDMPAMVTGRFEFVHNVHVPGMLHGAAVRPPTVGATLAAVDDRSVRDLPGVVKVVVKGNFVGVVAEKAWQARQAAARLAATWRPGPPLPAQSEFYDVMRVAPSRDAFVVNSGDVDERLAHASTVVTATYRYPYQMHGSMGTSCAVADVSADRATVWSPTQSAYPTRNAIAQLLGLAPDSVRLVFTRGAGCYGLNGADTVSFDAALLSEAVGKPVRVQLTRKDENAWENYGFPYVIDQRVGIGTDGGILAWDCEGWFATLGGRPGDGTPGNVVTGMLVGLVPASVRPARATPPTGQFRNGSNAAPSYVTGRVGTVAGGTGTVASERVLTHTVDSRFFTGPLRSPSRLQNTFAHECMLDEVAAQLGLDPVAYRLRHLREPRLRDVVVAAARAAAWSARASPGPGGRAAAVASGRGMSCVAYEGDNGYAAMVAEIEVDVGTGEVRATRFVVAQDSGPISNPDGLRNQIEGGTLQGFSRTMGEEVTWAADQVTSIDWRTYHSLSLGFDPPAIVSVLVNRPDMPATGAGETAITLVAAAVGNAIFDATGARVREVPFTAARIQAAMAARTAAPSRP